MPNNNAREKLIEELIAPIFHDGTRLSRRHAEELTETIFNRDRRTREATIEECAAIAVSCMPALWCPPWYDAQLSIAEEISKLKRTEKG